jgi:D-3-phosphoglycerate dehydrogenase
MGPVDHYVEERLAPFGQLVVCPDRDSQLERAPYAIAIIARGASVVDAELIGAACQLRVIGRTGVGVELIDLEAATKRGIPVVVTPGSAAQAVAEATIAMVLLLVKRMRPLDAVVREGRWEEREQVIPGDLEGSVLGIIGLGRIGSRVAKLASAFGAKVIAYDPARPANPSSAEPTMVELDDLLRQSEVICLHAPLTSATRRIIDRRAVALLQPGAIIVNAARGGLVDLDALYEALAEGRVAGVGLDVYDEEPPSDHPLFHHPDVALSPHVFGLSARARKETFRAMADGVAAVLEGDRPAAVANPEVF